MRITLLLGKRGNIARLLSSKSNLLWIPFSNNNKKMTRSIAFFSIHPVRFLTKKKVYDEAKMVQSLDT